MTEATREITDRLHYHLEAQGYDVHFEVPLERVGRHMRADIVALKVGYFWEHTDLRIYEIKTSRADFLQDVRAEKSYGYWPYAHRVYYAGPSDVVDTPLVPEPFGVVHVGAEIAYARESRFSVCPENTGLLLYLMAQKEVARRPLTRV